MAISADTTASGVDAPGTGVHDAALVAAERATAVEARMDATDQRLRTTIGFINAQHAELVDVAVELLELKDLGGWIPDGLATVELYLGWKAGLSPATAARVVAVARRVGEFPALMESFRRGELTLDQVAAATHQRVPATADASICRLAASMTVTQLRRTVSTYTFGTSIDSASDNEPNADTTSDDATGDETADAEPRCEGDKETDDRRETGFDEGHLRFGFDDLQRFSLVLSGGDADTGRLLEAALLEARDRLFREANHGNESAAGSADVLVQVSWLDALRDVCQRSLSFGGESPSRSDRYRVHVHVDADASGSDVFGWSLPDAITRYLTCDGLINTVFERDGVPISVGRTQRIVPDRTRIAVIWRDGGCAVPGCTATHGIEIHHIEHWSHGGLTNTANLVALCTRHHRLHHRGQLGISGNADTPGGVVFTNRLGRVIPASGARPVAPDGLPPPPASEYRHPIGERLDLDGIHIDIEATPALAS